MERNIPRLLFILLVSFMLSAPPPGAANHYHYIRWVLQNTSKLNWVDAHNYCSKWSQGLINLVNQEEAKQLSMVHGWIGLHHLGKSWLWSSGVFPPFFLWDEGEPVRGQNCSRKVEGSVRWKTGNCKIPHPFLCTKTDGILVQEKKTWEEALQHCRELHRDLASLPERDTDTFLLNREAMREDANTDEVWVGLRFLAGEWLWMSGQAAWGSNLPLCPAPYLHCGAIVHNDTEFKIMDCSEKRNFLCSKKLKAT